MRGTAFTGSEPEPVSAEPQDARIGWFKRLVVGLPASSAGIGSPSEHAKTSRRTSSPATPRSGSAVQAIEAPSVAHVATIRPPSRRARRGSWRAAHRHVPAANKLSLRNDCRSSSATADANAGQVPRRVQLVRHGRRHASPTPHDVAARPRAVGHGLGSCATEGPWDENDVLLVCRAVEAHLRAAAGSRFLPRCPYPRLSLGLVLSRSVCRRWPDDCFDRIVGTELCNRA